MTQAETHNAEQAWWPGLCEGKRKRKRERITDCVVVCRGKGKKRNERNCVFFWPNRL